MLDPAVDPRVPALGVLRRRIALATGFLLGATTVATIVHATHRADPPPPPPPPAPVPITLTAPPPIVVTIEKTEVPAAPAPALAAGLGCPVISQADRPIGRRVDIDRIDTSSASETEASHVQVVAAAAAPVLAALITGDLYASEDDGASWSTQLHDVSSLAIAADGTLYAIAMRDLKVVLAVKRRGGTWAFHAPPIAEAGKDRVGALADEVVWVHDSDLYTSVDRGKSWRPVRTPENAWEVISEPLFPWRGALYQVVHYYDMCGVDDLHVDRVDLRGTQSAVVFNNGYGPGEPQLSTSNGSEPSWTWTQTCRPGDDADRACEKLTPAGLQLLVAGTLRPVEGARTVATWAGSLVELCEGGARQLYRQFPFDEVAAVDWVGRPITVGANGAIYRWSQVNGWRRLIAVAPRVVEGSD